MGIKAELSNPDSIIRVAWSRRFGRPVNWVLDPNLLQTWRGSVEIHNGDAAVVWAPEQTSGHAIDGNERGGTINQGSRNSAVLSVPEQGPAQQLTTPDGIIFTAFVSQPEKPQQLPQPPASSGEVF